MVKLTTWNLLGKTFDFQKIFIIIDLNDAYSIRKEVIYMKNKHLTFDDRLEIEKGLKEGKSFKEIAKAIGKDCTTVSKEVKNHFTIKETGAHGRRHFDCLHGTNCPYRDKGVLCNLKNCEHYEKQNCPKLLKPPYVCNGCSKILSCTLSKNIYDSSYAYKEYKDNLVEARVGIHFTQKEIDDLNELLVPLIKEQGQSVHHVFINNKNCIMCSEKQIYNLIDLGILKVRNIDLPRKVRLRTTPKRRTYYKIDKKCLDGRRYTDYLKYMEEHPDTNVVQMDSVEGIKSGKVLLTLHFVNCSFMFAFLRDRNDAQSVIDIFNELDNKLGTDTFKKLFPVILTDNGSEFSNPKEIELEGPNQRTKIFYCEPGRSDQKGSCEVNHELIRRVLPKGTSFDNLTQEDINLLMSHINSYKRKKLNDSSALELFNLLYGEIIASKLGIIYIESNSINLTNSLLK